MREGRLYRCLAFAAVSTAAVASAHASAVLTDIVPPTGVGLERGVASVKCALGPTASHVSRGAVIAVEAPDRDVILTVAHGLPDTLDEIVRDCRVVGRLGRQLEIEQVWKSPSTGAVSEDWAVLLTHGRIEGNVRRLRVASVSPDVLTQLVAAEAPVRLLLRYAPATQGDCRLRAQPVAVAIPELVRYSCPSAPGSSGSPLTIGVDGDGAVIAIHLGWGIGKAREAGHSSSVARLLDDAIIAALREAAVRAALPELPMVPGDRTSAPRRRAPH